MNLPPIVRSNFRLFATNTRHRDFLHRSLSIKRTKNPSVFKNHEGRNTCMGFCTWLASMVRFISLTLSLSFFPYLETRFYVNRSRRPAIIKSSIGSCSKPEYHANFMYVHLSLSLTHTHTHTYIHTHTEERIHTSRSTSSLLNRFRFFPFPLPPSPSLYLILLFPRPIERS